MEERGRKKRRERKKKDIDEQKTRWIENRKRIQNKGDEEKDEDFKKQKLDGKIELEKNSQIYRGRNIRLQVINNRSSPVKRLDMEFDGEVIRTAVLDMLRSTWKEYKQNTSKWIHQMNLSKLMKTLIIKIY